MLRQTEEANVIVASSYNAVVKWSLRNSLFKYVGMRIFLEGSHSGRVRLPRKQKTRKGPRVRIPFLPPNAGIA